MSATLPHQAPAAQPAGETDHAAIVKAAEAEAQLREQAAERRRRLREARRRQRIARMQLVGEGVAASWQFVMRDIGGLAGMALVSYGAWQTYPPAGYIVAGVLLLAGAWIAGSKDT